LLQKSFEKIEKVDFSAPREKEKKHFLIQSGERNMKNFFLLNGNQKKKNLAQNGFYAKFSLFGTSKKKIKRWFKNKDSKSLN
jgi:hypothetical protein